MLSGRQDSNWLNPLPDNIRLDVIINGIGEKMVKNQMFR